MATYSALASTDIRSYVWSILQNEDILIDSDYYVDGFTDYIVPIIPAQQMPEITNLLPGKTYMVYDYEARKGRENWWISEEEIRFSILSSDYDKINIIMNCLFDYFRRFDDSARDINTYISDKNSQFRFHTLYIDSITSPEPFEREGNLQVGQIKICYAYSRKLNDSGRFQ